MSFIKIALILPWNCLAEVPSWDPESTEKKMYEPSEGSAVNKISFVCLTAGWKFAKKWCIVTPDVNGMYGSRLCHKLLNLSKLRLTNSRLRLTFLEIPIYTIYVSRNHELHIIAKMSRPHSYKMRVPKYYLRRENMVNENKILSYCDMWIIIKNNEKVVLHYVKLTNPISFQTRFPKRGPTYMRQVVNPWHQTLQGQSVAKPGTSL